mmetsp:Transcript_10923/g.22721  ORF Transcript_10923/g.22721 Transcript_10923/m.22721 type:complete len:97 (+) Transcript_10923:1440-1730(+)
MWMEEQFNPFLTDIVSVVVANRERTLALTAYWVMTEMPVEKLTFTGGSESSCFFSRSNHDDCNYCSKNCNGEESEDTTFISLEDRAVGRTAFALMR